MTPPTIRDRLAGGVWGHLVGDAMGVPYEFKKPSGIRRVTFGAAGSHHQPPGTWSDDGAMMLATLDSLLSVGFDPADQGRRFLDWFHRGGYTPDGDGAFDYGGVTAAALDRLRHGAAAETAGGKRENENGNGSLMRILPLALVGRDLMWPTLVDQAHRSSRVTHGHAWSQATCALYVLVAQALLNGADREAALATATTRLRSEYDRSESGEAMASALARLLGHPLREGRGFVVDSFWSAWDAFAGAKNYEETVVRAISYGNDTDTTACIAGGLAGITWGIGGIPEPWVTSMRGHAVADPLVERLLTVPVD